MTAERVPSPFLDETQAAAFLDVAVRTLRRWRHTGKGPDFRKHGKHVVYDKHDLIAYSASTARRSTSEVV